MCRGCCNQLFLRDEFHRGGIAGLLRELSASVEYRETAGAAKAALVLIGTIIAQPIFAFMGGSRRGSRRAI